MRCYTAFGLRIASDWPLDELAPAADGPCDVRITRRRIEPDEEWLSEDGQHIVAYYFDQAVFLVLGGREIVVDIRKEVPDEDIKARLLGEMMAGIMRQRGWLVLHASAVSDGVRAVAILGESGWGKSTLVEYLCQQGYGLVTDDVMPVDLSGPAPVVIPSYAQIRLRPDAAERLVPHASEVLVPIERNGFKQARNGVRMAARAVPLAAVLFLQPHFDEETALVEIAPTEALMRTIAHTRAKNLIHTNAQPLLKEHLAQCHRLLRDLPCRVLTRRRGFDALPEYEREIGRFLGAASRQPAAV
ncbi:MAG: hypothetical protein ACK41D_04775 [Rubricoccaceae bacterium]